MKNDDLSAIAEYPAMMKKAKDLEDSLKKQRKVNLYPQHNLVV